MQAVTLIIISSQNRRRNRITKGAMEGHVTTAGINGFVPQQLLEIPINCDQQEENEQQEHDRKIPEHLWVKIPTYYNITKTQTFQITLFKCQIKDIEKSLGIHARQQKFSQVFQTMGRKDIKPQFIDLRARCIYTIIASPYIHHTLWCDNIDIDYMWCYESPNR